MFALTRKKKKETGEGGFHLGEREEKEEGDMHGWREILSWRGESLGNKCQRPRQRDAGRALLLTDIFLKSVNSYRLIGNTS